MHPALPPCHALSTRRTPVSAKTAFDNRPPPPAASSEPLPPPVVKPAAVLPPDPSKPPPDGPPPELVALVVGLAAATSILAAAHFGSTPPATIPQVLDAADAADVGGRSTLGVGAAVSAIVGDPHFLVSAGLGLGAFVQTLTGFGFAIVSVGALSQISWIVHSNVFDDIQPIAATLSGSIAWVLLARELELVQWKKIAPLIVASTLFAPVGALSLKFIRADIVLKGLGALIAGYVGFSVSNVKVPKALGEFPGAVGLGAVAGFFGGAFDISGPPLVVHGQAAGWGESFRRNLMAIVAVNGTVVVGMDLFEGRLNDFYYLDLLKYAIPGAVLGTIAGSAISKKLDPAGFKKVVLGTCFIMGVKLMLS